MRLEHVGLLACPACRGELTLTGQPGGAGQVADGELGCGACGAVYPVRGRVPRFVSTANYASGFGLQWNTHARTQYDSFNGTRISESRFFGQTKWPRELRGQVVLEVGSGSGRFTEQAASTGATVVSLEYSSAVEANIAANGDRDNVLVVQADLYSMPLREASFDRVVCIGVLQHTPDVERAFLTLVRYLKPGGHLAVDVYRRPRGVRRLLNTKYWVRPLTSRVPPAALYAMTSRYVKAMWPVARLLAPPHDSDAAGERHIFVTRRQTPRWLRFGKAIELRIGSPVELGGLRADRAGVAALTVRLQGAMEELLVGVEEEPPPGPFGRWLTDLFNERPWLNEEAG